MYCGQCGEKCSPNDIFCGACGHRLIQNSQIEIQSEMPVNQMSTEPLQTTKSSKTSFSFRDMLFGLALSCLFVISFFVLPAFVFSGQLFGISLGMYNSWSTNELLAFIFFFTEDTFFFILLISSYALPFLYTLLSGTQSKIAKRILVLIVGGYLLVTGALVLLIMSENSNQSDLNFNVTFGPGAILIAVTLVVMIVYANHKSKEV